MSSKMAAAAGCELNGEAYSYHLYPTLTEAVLTSTHNVCFLAKQQQKTNKKQQQKLTKQTIIIIKHQQISKQDKENNEGLFLLNSLIAFLDTYFKF